MPAGAVLDDVLELAVTPADHSTLQQQVSELADVDLQHTHDYLHNAAASGKLLPKFGKDDMEKLHGAVEAEQAKRAQASGQQAPAATPLQWPSGGALQTKLGDDHAARMPGHLTTIRDRKQAQSLATDPNVGGGVDRSKIPHEDFVFPEDAPDGGFPIVKQGDVSDAVSSWGRYKGTRTFAEFKSRLTAIAKRKGFTAALPDKWSDPDLTDDIDRLRSVTRIGTISLSDGAAAQSWIQVAKTGEFVSSRYGEFAITPANLSQMLRNFKTKMPQAPTKLPVDYDHLSMDPQKPGDGKAAGWFVDLELRNNGGELWGLVEWTPDAADAISKKEYQFVSPSFARNYTDKQGKKIGTTLLAAAITNHPFLEGMAPLTLCADGDLAIQLTNVTTRSVHVNRPAGEDLDMAKKTFSMKTTNGQPVDIDQDELDASDYVKGLKSDHAAALKKAKDDAADAVDAAKKNLRGDNEEVVSLRTKVDEYRAEVIELRNGRETDRKARLTDQAQARFDRLVSLGKAKPAEKDRAMKLAQRDIDASKPGDAKVFDLFDDWCDDHKTVVVKLGKTHGGDPEADTTGGNPEDQFLKLAADKQKADPKLTLDKAIELTAKENPELYRRANQATVLQLNGGGADQDDDE